MRDLDDIDDDFDDDFESRFPETEMTEHDWETFSEEMDSRLPWKSKRQKPNWIREGF